MEKMNFGQGPEIRSKGMSSERPSHGFSSHEHRAVIDMAYTKAQEVFRHTIDMQQFASPQGNYDRQMVQQDSSAVADLRRKFDLRARGNPENQDAKQMSDIFEAMIADNITKNNWFGFGAELIATSEYDDYVGGVDGVLHLKSPNANDYLALGIDVTFSQSKLKEKIDRIKELIKDGNMSRLKYFQLPDGSYKGELRDVPNIVLGADASSVMQMCRQWTDPMGAKILSKHWMQAQLLDMAIEECLHFAQFAQQVGNEAAYRKYAYMYERVRKIKSFREKLLGGTLPTDRDLVYRELQRILGQG